MGDGLVLRLSDGKDPESKVVSELAEYALIQQGVPYRKETVSGPPVLIENGAHLASLQEMLACASALATENTKEGYDCRRTRLLMNEFVVYELKQDERDKVKDHLIANCEVCLRHLAVEVEIQTTQYKRSIGRS